MNRSIGCVLVFLSMFAARFTDAAVVQFTVDPDRSSLTLITAISLFTTPLTTIAQGSDSLTTSYSGNLLVDVTASTIQILNGSELVAGNSGNWLPGADYNLPDYLSTPAPANYGVITDLSPLGLPSSSPSAVRNLRIALSDTTAKPLVAGAFDESGTTTDYTSGTVYYSAGASPPITDLAGTVNPGNMLSMAGDGTLLSDNGVDTLTIPFSIRTTYFISVLAVTQTLEGVIVATAVPEPAGLAVLALGAVMLLRRSRS